MLKNKQPKALKRFLLVFALLAGLISVGLVPLAAQEGGNLGNGLRINRLRQEYTLQPGQAEAYDIEVTNVSQGTITVVAVINDFESDNETGQPRLLTGPDESSPYSLQDHVELPEPFSIEPGETETVTIRVQLPNEITPGGYFGAVRFAPSNIQGEDGTIALTASVGSLLLVNVPGDVQESMSLNFLEARERLETNETVSRVFFETAPDVVAAGLENTGGSILQPFGRVSIKNIFGHEVYSYEFNGGQSRSNVLPRSSRTFEEDIHNTGPIGRYTIEANLSYGEGGGNIITASSTFWVIPWRIILAVMAVLALVIWFATRGIKIYNRRVVDRAKRNS